MTTTDLWTLPSLETALSAAAGFLNTMALPAATPASVATAIAAVPCLIALAWIARRLARRPARTESGDALAARLDDLDQRLKATEQLLADSTSEAGQLRQRLEQVMTRQETIAAGAARSGLRQAIALSKHGATTRQLVDTCGLSLGEAHLVQTLYGRPPGDAASGEFH